MIEWVVSVFFATVSLRFWQHLLLIAPLTSYAGYWWITRLETRTPELNFLVCFVELPLLCLFCLQTKLRDRFPLLLVWYPLLALPALLLAPENFLFSAFFTLLLSLSGFFYANCLQRMELLCKENVFETIVAIWLLFGIATKVYVEYRLGGQAGYPLGVYALICREGGLGSNLGASNHVAQVILLFLPFVRRAWLSVLAQVFLMLCFSRGIYVALAVFWLGQCVLHFRGKTQITQALLGLVVVVGSAGVVSILQGDEWADIVALRLYERVGYDQSLGLDFKSITERTSVDERWGIFDEAVSMAKESNYLGVGVGGFFWGEARIGASQEYSNSHNLYLTLWAEGGVFFTLVVIGILVYMLWLAWQHTTTGFMSLFIFLIYGLYSGQIWEASRTPSLMDYYFLLAVFAYIRHEALPSQKSLMAKKGCRTSRACPTTDSAVFGGVSVGAKGDLTA